MGRFFDFEICLLKIDDQKTVQNNFNEQCKDDKLLKDIFKL